MSQIKGESQVVGLIQYFYKCFVKIFSQSIACLFISIVSSVQQTFLNFIESNLFFSFVVFASDVMAKKYADGLPLARQEKIWAREGVELSRATMAKWVIQCAQTWLKHRHMKQRLLEQEVIHADETVIQG